MNTRTVLIHNYARKNKSRRKKYFVLSICSNYSEPRLDYFFSQEKWNLKKHEVYNNNTDNVSYQSIDLSNLFFIDDAHRLKPKNTGLNLYKEDRHLSLTLQSEELKKKWKELFENIIYKNSRLKSYCKIEHVLEVTMRLKRKENIDKSVYSQLRGNFRACFTKSFLMFVNSSLEKPALTIQYPFIRQWESRFDGTFRLEIGRAAFIGECILILQLADYEDSKSAHAMLTNCIMSFKLSKPDPPKIRNVCEKSLKRNSLTSCYSKPVSTNTASEVIAKRHESCITFATDTVADTSPNTDVSEENESISATESNNYVPMNGCAVTSPTKSHNVLDYFEHTNRIYKCPNCGCFTKVIIYCSRCCNTVNLNSFSLLCKTDPNSFELQRQLFEPTRSKAQSLTDKPNRISCIYKTKQFLSDPSKTTQANTSKSSSKTSTNDASSGSKQESQTSLSMSANRHDDDIFMELDFDNLDSRISSATSKAPIGNWKQSQLKCANCLISLIHKTPCENLFNKRCSTCFEELITLSIPIKDTVIGSEWRPRTTSMLSATRPRHVAEYKVSFQSEYVEARPPDISSRMEDS